MFPSLNNEQEETLSKAISEYCKLNPELFLKAMKSYGVFAKLTDEEKKQLQEARNE